MKKRWFYAIAVSALLGGMMVCFIGCEVDSGDTGTRGVDINVWGFYRRPDGGVMVSPCSGSCMYSLNLRQNGDELEGIDDHGAVYRGTIGSVNSEAKSATFVMTGTSSAGIYVTLDGHFEVSSGVSTMFGTWIEPDLYGTIYAQSAAPSQPSNALSVVASPNSLSAGNSATVTARGGSGTYVTWSLANTTYGSYSGSGSAITYTASTNSQRVTQTITVSDSEGSSAAVNITQN